MRREFVLVLSAIFIAGCATVAPVSTPPYFPANPSVVLLKHTGDLLATGTASTGGETFQAAYGLTPHLGVLASGSMALHKAGDSSENQYSGAIGAGIFDTMTSSHVYGELYGGIGWGSGSSTFQGWEYSIIPELAWQISGNEQTRFATAWIQGATGYAKNNLSGMILLRISDVDIYHDVKQESVRGAGIENYYSTPYDTTISSTGKFWIFTPGFEVRYGLDHIQLIASVFTQFIDPASDDNLHALGSLGLCYKF